MITTGDRGGNASHECSECGRWAYTGGRIRHSTRCAEQAQYADPATASVEVLPPDLNSREVARLGKAGHGLTTDQLVDAVARRQISISDAMNRDD